MLIPETYAYGVNQLDCRFTKGVAALTIAMHVGINTIRTDIYRSMHIKKRVESMHETITVLLYLILFSCCVFLGADCFFVKEFTYHYTKGRCINDTGQIQSSGTWGNLSFLEFSFNSCLDPAAQFRFRDNGAMLNLKRQGCLAAFHRNGSGYDLDMFYLYVDSVSLDTAACAQKPNEGIYRAITQTSDGKLTVYYKGKDNSSFETWCAVDGSQNSRLYKNYGINPIELSTSRCHFRFIFGKFFKTISHV